MEKQLDLIEILKYIDPCRLDYQDWVNVGRAHKLGIKTWMSCEPVLDEQDIYTIIECAEYVDLFKIGKLNYFPSNINWGEFGRKCERLCKAWNRNYYIKAGLREIMEKVGAL